MKFIHTADIHLDSPLCGLASYQNAPTQALRGASRAAFTRLIDAAIDEAVDFMVIAGDLYDGNWRDYNTGHFFVREMGRLNQAGIPVYLLYGNHDAESEMTRRLTLPANVHLFDSRKPVTHKIDALRVALHGRSFKEAATTENLALSYPAPVAGWLNIGVLHTALEGYAAHARYAPCSVQELQAKGYDYWALGHVHEHAVLSESPWVVFPGNLQGRHIREAGPRGAVLVTASEAGIQSVERLIVDVLRWERLHVDVSAAADLPAVVALVGQALEALLLAQTGHWPLALRVSLVGRTPVHGALFGLEAQVREELLAQAAALGGDRLWIEKLRLETTPALDSEQISARADAIADLQALLAEVPQDADFMRSLAEDLQQLTAKVPLELIAALPEFTAIRAGDVAAIVAGVTPALLAQLAYVAVAQQAAISLADRLPAGRGG
ncbi:metallophosphoesterase family protein [Roseateles sp.]|uniref:metallophosphoesterase family protein n=1 Tax=Roseateles sp. TaxID=1971397 RepID=UPI0039DFE3FC